MLPASLGQTLSPVLQVSAISLRTRSYGGPGVQCPLNEGRFYDAQGSDEQHAQSLSSALCL